MTIPMTNVRDDWQVFADWLIEQGDARGPAIAEVLRRTTQNVEAVWMGVCIVVADCRVRGSRCPECVAAERCDGTRPPLDWVLSSRRKQVRLARINEWGCPAWLSCKVGDDGHAPAAEFDVLGAFTHWGTYNLTIPF